MKNEKTECMALYGHGVNYKLSVKLLSALGLPHDAVSICIVMKIFPFVVYILYIGSH